MRPSASKASRRAVVNVRHVPGYEPGGRCGALGAASISARDFAPRAEALVHEAAGVQRGEGVAVDVESLALPDHVAVPVEPDRGEICELSALVFGRRLHTIEVFHADDELAAGRARSEPCEQRGA